MVHKPWFLVLCFDRPGAYLLIYHELWPKLALHSYLVVGTGFQVVVMHVVEDGKACILPECNVDMWDFMKAQLRKLSPPKAKIETILSKRYAALFQGEWWRVRVEKVEPLQLRYIDYGNVEEGETEIRLLPRELLHVKPLVIIQY